MLGAVDGGRGGPGGGSQTRAVAPGDRCSGSQCTPRLRPESIAGVALLAGAAYLWAMTPETLSPLVLVAAAGMVLVHVSALGGGAGAGRMRVDRAQVRRWAARALFLWLAAATVWGLSVALADLPQGRLAYALGLTLLTVDRRGRDLADRLSHGSERRTELVAPGGPVPCVPTQTLSARFL